MNEQMMQDCQQVRRRLANGFSQQVGPAFEQLLKGVRVVSFDLFDTLIQRTDIFSPKDLFYQVQAEAQQRLGLHLDDFVACRVRAESQARVRAWGARRGEVTLTEIYSEIGRRFRLPAATLHSLQQIELDCERAVLVTLASGQALWQRAMAAGKQVIITSDTYFDQAFVEEILQRTGYGNGATLYLSSVWGQTKQEGSLYTRVLRDLACVPNQVLHVGDNLLSDVTMALGKGLRTLHVPTAKQQLRRRYGLDDRPSGNLGFAALLCKLSERPVPTGKRVERKALLTQVATENLALLYCGFGAWLLAQLRAGGYRRVYFAARDGLIMKRFFDLLATAAGFEIDSRYLYISRAALYPSLIFSDPATAQRLFCRTWDYLTLEQVLQRIGLSYAENKTQLARYGLIDAKQRLDEAGSVQFKAFLQQNWSQLEGKNQAKYRSIVAYLRQERVLSTEKAAFVDIGWHGSSQDCLLKLLKQVGITKELHGYYLGTFEKPAGIGGDFQAKGFLVENQEPAARAQLVRFGPSLLELFHSAGHGGVLGYTQHGAVVAPVLENYSKEQEQFREIIEPMQQQAFDFIAQQLANSNDRLLEVPDPEVVARLALRPVYAPTAAEAETFGRLRIASDFGGRMKSIAGVIEWDLRKIEGEMLPDGTIPIWRPGFQCLKQSALEKTLL